MQVTRFYSQFLVAIDLKSATVVHEYDFRAGSESVTIVERNFPFYNQELRRCKCRSRGKQLCAEKSGSIKVAVDTLIVSGRKPQAFIIDCYTAARDLRLAGRCKHKEQKKVKYYTEGECKCESVLD